MNKFYKIAGLSLMLAGSLALLGCGDDKKPEPKKAAAQTTQAAPAKAPSAEQEKKNLAGLEAQVKNSKKPTPENNNPNAPKPASPLYVYTNAVKTADQVCPMTPEVIAAFEKEAKNFKLGEGKKWVYKTFTYNPKKEQKTLKHYWIGSLENHHSSYFKDADGKNYMESHQGYIMITVDLPANTIKNIESFKIDVTKENGKDGKKTVYTKK